MLLCVLPSQLKNKDLRKSHASALIVAILVMMFISMVLIWQYQNFRDQANLEQRQTQEMRSQIKRNLNEVRGAQNLRK